MKNATAIVNIRVYVLKERFKWIIIELTAESGQVGWGEAYPEPGILDALKEVATEIIGQDSRKANLIMNRLKRKWPGSDVGACAAALSGIEIALWDLNGKYLGAPVSDLLGGAIREKIPLYIDCYIGRGYTPEGYRARAIEVVEMGFRALKFDLDDPTVFQSEDRHLPPRDWDDDRWNRRITPDMRAYKTSIIRAVREAIGPDIELGIDFHWYYNPADVVKLAHSLEPFDISFLEDPIYPGQTIDVLLNVSTRVRQPLLYGELIYNFSEFQRLIQSQSVGIVAPEITRCGGISGCLEVARFADRYGILVSPHNVNSLIATAALAHVAAVIPNLYYVEYRYREETWWDRVASLVDGRPMFEGPFLNVPTAPGLGIQVDTAFLRGKAEVVELS